MAHEGWALVQMLIIASLKIREDCPSFLFSFVETATLHFKITLYSAVSVC